MCTKQILLVLAFLSRGAVSQELSQGGQWLIEKMEGSWEVQELGQQARPMSGQFEVLMPTSKIRCLTLPCALVASVNSGTLLPLPLPTPVSRRLNRWLSVPVPTDPPVVRTAVELQQVVAKAGVRGGSDKGATLCTGDFPLQAPTCSEVIDLEDFRIRWTPRPSEAGRSLALLIGSADSSDKKRWNSISADAGEFQDQTVRTYLSTIQAPDRPVDVVVRLMRTENLDAVRLVRLPSKADESEYRRKLTAISSLPDLSRSLTLLDLSLKMGMWSKAAQVSLDLMAEAPESLEIHKYALVGLCHSDFVDEIAKVRSLLKDAGVTGFCPTEATPQ